jgi:hypothetical protein
LTDIKITVKHDLSSEEIAMDTGLNMRRESLLDDWLLECAEQLPEVWGKTKYLYRSWSSWSLAKYGETCSARVFTRELKRRGFVTHRLSDGLIVAGIRLKKLSSQ